MTEKAQKEFFERLAGHYDSRFLRARWPRNQELKAREVSKVLGDAVREGPVIEIGCGTGQIAGELLAANPKLRYVGSDLSPGMLDIARERLAAYEDRIELRVSERNGVPAGDAPYAGAFGIDVLHHVEDPPLLLRNLRESLEPGAPIVFLEANPIFPITAAMGVIYREERGVFKMRPKFLGPWLRHAGFERVDVSLGPVYTPPGPPSLDGFLGGVDRVMSGTPLLRNLALYFKAQGRAPGA